MSFVQEHRTLTAHVDFALTTATDPKARAELADIASTLRKMDLGKPAEAALLPFLTQRYRAVAKIPSPGVPRWVAVAAGIGLLGLLWYASKR